MFARWPGPAALAAAGLAALAAGGCAGASAVSESAGNQLAIYSSLPLQGPYASASQQIVGGEKLALAQAGGRVWGFQINYASLDDANPVNGQPSPNATAADAKTAAQDTSTIAYLGDFGSAATALSLPLINAAGILQVSPASPYVGLTSSLDAGQDEPERFYPSGRRTFVRLQPGDAVQAGALALLMRSLAVRSVYVIDDQDPFETPLAQIAAADAARAGVRVSGQDSIAVSAGATYDGELERVRASGAQAVLFVGGGGPGAVTLWRALHAAAPGLLLLGTSAMADEAFTSRIGAAAARTYLTTPMLATQAYPPQARRVLAQYRRTFGGEAGPYVLYGYEAMSAVLAAIRAAGDHGNDRGQVIERFFAIRDRESVLGRYSVTASGETTLARYGVDRVVNGRPVFLRALSVAQPFAR